MLKVQTPDLRVYVLAVWPRILKRFICVIWLSMESPNEMATWILRFAEMQHTFAFIEST